MYLGQTVLTVAFILGPVNVRLSSVVCDVTKRYVRPRV